MAEVEVNPIYQLDSVKEHMVRAAKRAGEIYAENLDAAFGVTAMENDIESPIEAIFLVWWEALREVHYWQDVQIQTQARVEVGERVRRIDFTVLPSDISMLIRAERLGMKAPAIAVELDGHEFHERTKAQVVDRNTRDRELQQLGWTVFHFSGSELYRDPEACLFEVVNYALTKYSEFDRELFYAERGQRPPD